MACFGCGAIFEYASRWFEKLKKEIRADSGFQIRAVGAGRIVEEVC
jgi:Fe2+ or Zn2+ uptake regulation protein